MQVVSLIVRSHDATQQNLASVATQAEDWGSNAVWASDRRSIVQHLILDFVPKTIVNPLVTMDCCARGARPALG